jgi:hypothetical protein
MRKRSIWGVCEYAVMSNARECQVIGGLGTKGARNLGHTPGEALTPSTSTYDPGPAWTIVNTRPWATNEEDKPAH